MNLSTDTIILYSVNLFTVLLLWFFIPRDKLIEAQISFLFMQVLTWLFGAIVVENKLVEYPVRFLENAYHASFTFEYFVFPAVSALYNLHFPSKKGWFDKIMYMLAYPTAMTIVEVFLEKYTNLVKYVCWSWYWSFITLLITLVISYAYYKWIFKKIKQKFGSSS